MMTLRGTPIAPPLLILLLTVNIACAGQPLLRPGDRVALLGGSFVERLQSSGALETELHCRRPRWKLSLRNLGWSGDDVHGVARKRFDEPEQGYERLLQDIETADPTVVLVAYGFAEATNGPDAVRRFAGGMTRLVGDITATQRRVVLMTPVAMPGFKTVGYRELIDQCRATVREVGDTLNLPVVEIDWRPSDPELDEQRLFPNRYGYQRFGRMVADALVGGPLCEKHDETMSQLITAKNQLFFHRYQPQNETYLFLFRKHEQGNNATEIPMFDPLIKQADEAIWKAAGRSSER